MGTQPLETWIMPGKGTVVTRNNKIVLASSNLKTIQSVINRLDVPFRLSVAKILFAQVYGKVITVRALKHGAMQINSRIVTA